MQRSAAAKAQEVTDSEGRRRFHGAFTGGFSAGYFNSVGSKEGWQPRAFSSSRSERAPAARFQQRPEDFMDEEDDPLLGQRLETTERYDTLQAGAKRALQQDLQRRRQPGGDRPAPIPGFVVPDEWVLPANNSVGAELLRRMGWKEGQGIGQRVRKRRADAGELVRVDCGPDGTKSEVAGAEDCVYLPPRNGIDVKTAFPAPKVDRYGAGFDPFASAPEFARYKQQQLSHKSEEAQRDHRQIVTFADAMKPTTGSYRAVTSYGLGALEDNDDLDVYGGTSMGEFDTEIGPPRLGGAQPTKLLANTAEADEPKRRRRSRAVCYDGRKPLPGFELAKTVEKPPKTVTERLQVPSDYKPVHVFSDEDGDDTDAVPDLYRQYNFSTMKHGRSTLMTVKDRAALLGTRDAVPGSSQATLKSTPSGTVSSVFDLMQSKDKQKLMEAVSRAKEAASVAAAGASARQAASTHSTVAREVPTTGASERQPLVQGSNSDQLRATISASIAKRFVSSAVEGGDAPPTSLAETTSGASVPAVPAAVAKRSYRSQSPWVPNALLCKRFHVKCAGATSRSGDGNDGDKKPDLFAQELVPQLVEFAAGRSVAGAPAAAVAPRQATPRSAHKEAESDELPPLPEVERPATDLLKSIFEPSDASADEEDASEEDEDSESDSEASVNLQVDPQQSVVREPEAPNAHGRRGAADYFSSDSSSSDEEGVTSVQTPLASALPTADSGGVVSKLATTRDDSDSESDDEPKRKKHKKHRRRGGNVDSDDESDRKSRKKRSKDKKHKKDKKSKKRHREASKKRTRSRSPSASKSTRRHRHRRE